MLTSAPGCRAVCKGKPGDVVEHLVVVFERLKIGGMTEEQALRLARNPDQLARLLPSTSLGALPGGSEAVVSGGCADCAVNYAYSD